MPERAAKKRRSRFGCNTCRSRKVRCDERPDGCFNCERLRLQCTGYNQPDLKGNAHTPASKPDHTQTRTRRSCNQCRKARSKCSGEVPRCGKCRNADLACSYQDLAPTPSKHHAAAGTWNREQPENRTLETTATPRESSHNQSTTKTQEVLRGHVSDTTTGGLLDWLYANELPPSTHQVRLLVSRYFQHVHPLRCFAFIHKPSYMGTIDDNPRSALLHIICTLGAQFHALELGNNPELVITAGQQWASKALSLVLSSLDKISVENLMTAQLLYDYALRMANFPQAFMLSAMLARMTQALQINLEYSTDVLCQDPNASPSVTVRESRRRLMWSCYITDALCGSGVDQLTLIKDDDLKIQLPCNEKSFLSGEACITSTLTGNPLPLLPFAFSPTEADANLGIAAYFVQHIEIRKRILKYIKHLDKMKQPWLVDSEFASFNNELQTWYETLPDNLQFNTKTILLRQETNQLGALCLLHCAYHQTLCDLYRIGTPSLYKLRSAFTFPPEHTSFQKHLQWSLFKAGRTLAAVMAEAKRHGPHNLSDSWLPTIAYDSNRIMLYYLTKIYDHSSRDGMELIFNTIPYLQSNVEVLNIMRATNVVTNGLHQAADEMLRKLGVDSHSIHPRPDLVLHDPYLDGLDPGRLSGRGTPTQSAPDYVLNPLSIYRMARSNIPERHAPENASSPLNLSTSIWNEHNPSGESSIDAALQDGFDLDMSLFFAPDLAWNWQPAETILASRMDNEGLLPWADSSHMVDFT